MEDMDTHQPELPEDDLSTMEKGLRHYLIAKIVKVVVPKPDANAAYDARLLEFVEYCKFMEKKAFGNARTRDEYFDGLASIIFKLQKKVQQQPPGLSGDPYARIPMSHEMPEFMGMTQEEFEEFDEQQNPQGPSQTKNPLPPHIRQHVIDKLGDAVFPEQNALKQQSPQGPFQTNNLTNRIPPHIRQHVVDKLGDMLFPAPDVIARQDGRMVTITQKLRQIEASAFEEAEDSDDYYNRASLAAYRLQKSLKKNGESYLDDAAWTPSVSQRVENEELPDLM